MQSVPYFILKVFSGVEVISSVQETHTLGITVPVKGNLNAIVYTATLYICVLPTLCKNLEKNHIWVQWSGVHRPLAIWRSSAHGAEDF